MNVSLHSPNLAHRRPLFARALLIVACVLAAALAPAVSRSNPPQESPERIVAIGDIHGDFDALAGILQTAGLINEKHDWTGGRAVLVQTGDFLDRGPQQREVMDLLMHLERQAPRAGGRVVVLLGNHEVMNIQGDLRDIGPGLGQYVDKNSEKRRQSAWKQYTRFLNDRAKALGEPDPQLTPESEAAWMDMHPPGYLEHRDAFGPRGRYGRWLRDKPAMAKVGEAIFLHAGISPPLAGWKLADINTRVANELKSFDDFSDYFFRKKIILPFFTQTELLEAVRGERDHLDVQAAAAAAEAAPNPPPAPSEEQKQHRAVLEEILGIGSWFSVNSEGPLWFRGFATWTEEEGPAHIEKILATHGAQRVVVGHTPQRGSIRERFGGRVLLIDTGMLTSHYQGGRPSALEISGGVLTGIYPTERVVVYREPAARAVPTGHEFPSEAEGAHLGGGPDAAPDAAPEVAPAPAPLRAPAAPGHTWLGPGGEPLPFRTDEEVLEFLRTADVKSMKGIGQGINNPDKCVLEKDGIRLHAVFRDVDQDKQMAKLADGSIEMYFRDSYMFEIAAYELARLLGMDNVPPAVRRRVRGRWGSLQVFVEQALDEGRRMKNKVRPPDPVHWNRQVFMMRAFDRLIYNTDRNPGNILMTPDGKLWMIDHTRAFRRHDQLKDPELVRGIDRSVWKRLREVDDEALRAAARPYLNIFEIDGLLKRRRALITLIEQRVAELGEKEALFDVYTAGNR